MSSNNDSDNHNSRSNSLKSECGVRTGERPDIPYGSSLRNSSGPAQQIHMSREGQHTLAAQQTESHMALYLIVSLPSPKDGLLV